MIKIRQQNNYLVALESVAMTDIVMNMFIFFFISFSLLYTFSPERISKLEIKLPKAKSADKLEGSERIVLAVAKNGTYFIGNDRIGANNLKTALKAKMKDNPSPSVLLKIDGLARFDTVARALDIIHELNITKVSVATVKKD